MYAGQAGRGLRRSRDLFRGPLHPYTPAADRQPAVARGEGRVPRHPRPAALAAEPPAGCPFRSRCPRAMERCAVVSPMLREVQPRAAGSPATCTELTRVTACLRCSKRGTSRKVFGGGAVRQGARPSRCDDFSLAIDDEPPSITGHRRRERQRQDDPGAAAARAGQRRPVARCSTRQGPAALSGDERRQFLRDVQVIFQDPYEVYNPFYKVDHVLETPIAKFRLADSRDEARALIEETLRRGRAAAGGDARAVSAPTQRRSAPADHGGAGAAASAAPDHRRRAGLDGRRLAAGDDPGEPARS